MSELKLYLWNFDKLCTRVMGFALAYNKTEAIKRIEETFGKLTDKQKKVKPEVFTAPIGFTVSCD